jgi:anthranilate synthase/aminodeoxychorismate synthase-like glutamine amidotransferase
MIALLDNEDSFSHMLFDYLRCLHPETVFWGRGHPLPAALEETTLQGLVLSPGPGRPEEHPRMTQLLARFLGRIPVLGVCLGHQALGLRLGGTLAHGDRPMHGKISKVYHHGTGLFAGLPSPFEATRYHSLTMANRPLAEGRWTALTREGEVMALAAPRRLCWGLQFHPEAVSTQGGKQLLNNWLRCAGLNR